MVDPAADRLNYAEILRRPEPDFELTAAVGSTFSLDLTTLAAALLPLCFEGDAAGECRNNPVFLLHAMRKMLPKLFVFCDGANIKAPDSKQNRLLALLDRAVYPVKHESAFHPKFWLLKFSRGNEIRYRLVISSKNITFDRSWDMALVLDGVPSRTLANGAGLASMLRYLYASQWGKTRRLKMLAELCEDIRRVSFFNEDIAPEDLRFLPFGTGDEAADEFLLNDRVGFSRLLVISPFLSRNSVMNLFGRGRENSEKILISRKTALAEFAEEDLSDVDCYCVRDEVLSGESSENLNAPPEITQAEDIHAKLYLFQQYSGSSPFFYLGSANLTQNGTLSRNVELLARFKLSHHNVYEKLFRDLFPPGRNGIFEPYTFDAPPPEDAEETAREELEKLYRKLTLARWTARCEKVDGRYRIELHFSGKLPRECGCRIAPLYGSWQPLAAKVDFGEQGLEALSDFYRIRLESADIRLERLLVIDTLSQISDLAEERAEALNRSCLKKPEDLLEYLSYMLAEDPYMLAVSRAAGSDRKDRLSPLRESIAFSLYERMLYWAAKDKSRLLEIENVLTPQMSANEELSAICRLCETFYQTAGREK